MNQLACVYCKTLFEIDALVTSDAYIDKANKLRLSIYFPFENIKIEQDIRSLEDNRDGAKADFLKLTGVIQAHESIVPFLVQKIILPDPPPAQRPFVLAQPQLFWLDDIDVWYNFPKAWLDFLKPLTPQAVFDTLSDSQHEF